MNKKNLIKLALLPVLAIAFTFGLSYVGSEKNNPAMLAIDTAGYNKVYADSLGWQGVRGFATLIRATSQTFNTLYSTIQHWGLLFNFSLTLNGPVTGTDFWFYVSINNGDKSATGTVDSSPVSYTNGIQIKHGTALGTGGTVVFQLFFDNPTDSSGGEGCLLIVKPYYFEVFPGTVFSIDGIFEVRVKKPATDTIMYISFTGSPWKENPPTFVESGRVKLVEDGTNYNITGLGYVNVNGSDILHTVCTATPPEAGNAYYTLAYIAKKDSPHYSTALWGWNNTNKSNSVCGFTGYNYGHFNASTGFVCDGSPDTDCPDGAPYPLNDDVDALYTGMDNTPSTGEYDPAAISGLTIPFQTF